MGKNREPHTSDAAGRIEIVDLGADPDSPAAPVPSQQRTARPGGAKVVLTGAAALLILAAVQVSKSGGQEGPEAQGGLEAVETVVEKPDICGEVARANDAELWQGQLSSNRDAGPAPGKGYSLLGAWPAGSDHTVTYGRLYPDQSIEICGKPEDLAGLGITSSVRQEDLGDLPEGSSYAYELSSQGPANKELEVVGVRGEDGTIFDVAVLPDGSIRPLTPTVEGEAVPFGG